MIEVAGWWLPDNDTYFPQFVEGGPSKHNGFMQDHLHAAFKHVRKWDVSVDVGAHVGFWTRDMAERFAQVYAFESSPITFECLARNLNDTNNVDAQNVAVGERSFACRVEDDPTRLGNTGARFIRPVEGGPIRMVALDDLGIAGCDLLKIDVEGYEWQVLCGAAKLVKTHSPVVIMECDKRLARPRYGIADDAAERWLLENGYREVAHMRPDKIFAPKGSG